MQHLEPLSGAAEASWYAVRGDFDGDVERYVVSTPQTRRICNDPDLLGVEFNRTLEEGMTAALTHAPFRDLLTSQTEDKVCVVNFLRGGLNFELRRALSRAYGFNRHSSAFMSSQRQRKDGRWSVREDMYRKLDIPPDAVLVLGDVVATGVTIDNGFDVLVDHVVSLGSSLRGIVLVTIGCHKTEKVLQRIHEKCREAFGDHYQRTVAVYIEGKFRLVDSESELRIGIPGTDLIRPKALLAPELVLSQYEQQAYTLERCAIYDAGSRAFDVPRYVDDVREYWEQLRALGTDGLTLAEALDERWPREALLSADDFGRYAQQTWPGADDGLLRAIHEAHTGWWAGEAGQALASSEALVAVCDARIAALGNSTGAGAGGA